MEFIQNELKEIKELLRRQAIQQKEILTIDEAAEFLGLSKSRLYKMTSNKEIPYYKPGGKVTYLNRQDLEQWILNSRISSTSDVDFEMETYVSGNRKNIEL